MRAGELNRQIVIRKGTQARDAVGGAVTTASTVATVWAKRTDTGGQETWRGRTLLASIAAVFEIRYRTDVTAAMQVVDGSDIFEVRAVQNARPAGGGYEALELMCQEVPA